MSGPVLVGVALDDRDTGVVALGRTLARLVGAPLALVHAYRTTRARCRCPNRSGRSAKRPRPAVVSPVKLGGLATHQARRAATAIARLAGVEDAPDPGEPVLHGRLLIGERRTRTLRGRGDAEGAPLWWPAGKVAGDA